MKYWSMGPTLRQYSFMLFMFLIGTTGESWAQSGLKLPAPPQTVRLFENPRFSLESYPVVSLAFNIAPPVLKRETKLDSSGYLTVSETIGGIHFAFPAVVDFETYIKLKEQYLWKQMLFKQAFTTITGNKNNEFGALKLDIPIRIKNETFTRIFGSDKISLRVTGNISFDLSGRTEKRSGSAINARENQNTFSPRFTQTQQFTVEGKIGDKVTVSVQQNSEAVTDIENTLKLKYEGYDDEIIDKIEAGNVSLSLPSTKYVIFGGSNQGLFGLKASAHLGNLHFTTIASLEKGQQQELNISGGSSSSTTIIKDINYIQNRYFFIDPFYRDRFESGFSENLQTFNCEVGRDVSLIEVWISVGPQDPNRREAIAAFNPDAFKDKSFAEVAAINREGIVKTGFFRRLDESEFTYDRYRGYFVLNQPADDNTIVGIAFKTTGGQLGNGTLAEDLVNDPGKPVLLKLIKERNQNADSVYVHTWPLMMRNVYSLGGTNIQKNGFDIKLVYNKAGEELQNQGNNTFLNLFGLDLTDENGGVVDGGDEKVDLNPYVINRARGILMFPSLRPFDPLANSRFNQLDDKYKVRMYDLTSPSDRNEAHAFEMHVTSKSTKSTFDLGFYILEGSEVVTLNGSTLKRDKDYTIDYFSGQLTLISNEAKRSSSSIQIKYERANLFQLDKKTIVGGRVEYRFNEDAFMGLTALYLNKSTLDTRVRVGQEPFQNFVWDMNAAFKFRPRFITRALDALPFIETTDESNFNIEGEFAQSLPNPNTLDNPSTNDKKGVAYIDDFESSKRSTTLGIRYKTWSEASAPAFVDVLGGPVKDVQLDKSRARLTWFNPYTQVLIKDIWPNRDVNAQTGQTTDVLGLEFYREPTSDPDSAWVGIMRSTASYADQQKTKYIELWVLGDTGTVHIDVGRISEDWYIHDQIIDGKTFPAKSFLNTEDVNNNGLLDEGEDIGIDGIPHDQPGADPYDLWAEPVRGVNYTPDGVDYTGVNGTEGNGNARGPRYPDTEDLDGDGQLSELNAYFEYSFSLDPNDPESAKWITGSTEKGWRQFRIPLKDWNEKIGSPDESFQQMLNARIWLNGLPVKRTRIFFATIDFVGNEWEESGVSEPMPPPQVNDFTTFTKNDSIFTLATYNSEENAVPIPDGPDAYTSPPGVKGQVDRLTKAVSKEQSLVMHFNGLPGYSVAKARKPLFSKIAFVNYRKLKFFLYGSTNNTDPVIPAAPDEGESPLRFFIRFGADANNYYEYGQDVFLDWNKRNIVEIDLDQILKIKDIPGQVQNLSGDRNAYFKAVGNPSLNTIRLFEIGARNKTPQSFSGEIWVDEFRLADVRKESATALRIKTNLKMADVLRINAEWESKDADFHNISTQFGGGSTLERQNYSGVINIDKFLPASWDMSIPVDGRAAFSRSIPKYRPRRDELTGYKNDTFSKKLQSLFGLRTIDGSLAQEINANKTVGLGTTIKKRTRSNNPWVKYTLDQLLLDFDYSKIERSSWDIAFNNSTSHKERYTFKIPFPGGKFVKPFGFLRGVPVLKGMAATKVYYMPSSFSTSLNVSDVQSRVKRRDSTAVEKKTANTATQRTLQAGYRLTDKINFTFSRNYTTDVDFDSTSRSELYKNIFTRFNFGRLTNTSQSFKGRFNPALFSWLKPDFNYTADFRYQLTNSYRYKQATSRTTKRVGATINPDKLVKLIYTPKTTKKGRRRGRPRAKPKPKPSDDNKTAEKASEEKKAFQFPNPLLYVYNFLTTWKSVKMTYSLDNTISNQFLQDMPSLGYQFGFTNNPGVGQDSTLLGSGVNNLIQPSLSKNQSLKTSTSLNMGNMVRISLTHNLRDNFTSTDGGRTKSGAHTSNYFSLSPDPQKSYSGSGDLKQFIPDWTVSISGVEKYFFFKSFAKSISIDHGHSGKYDAKKRLNSDGKTFETYQETFTDNWQPLIGFNIKTTWGVNTTIRMTSAKSYSYSQSGGATKTQNNSLTVSLNYSKSTGFRIPLPIWPFKGRTFKNEVNFQLTFDSSDNTSFQRQAGTSDFQEQQNNTSWKLRPSATYRFNSRVQGSLFFETGATTNKISGTYSYSEFGINVNIAIKD